LWIVQLSLGLLFLVAGSARVVADQRIDARSAWLTGAPRSLRQLFGVTELLCAACLLTPALMRSDLAPLSAGLLALAMGGFIVHHHRRHDEGRALVGALLFGGCLFVAVGRFFLVPLF